MNIFTETVGEGKDVVLLHGWTHDHRSMQPIKDILQKKYRVTLVDLPGAGQSDWDDSIKCADDCVDAILEHLPEKALYIGWSFGGFVSIAMAARYPKRVEHFIGIGTGPRLIEDTDWSGVPQPGFSALMKANTSEELKKMVIDWYKTEIPSIEDANHPCHTLLTNIEYYGLAMSVDVWQKGLKISDSTDLREEYKTIGCPIDLIVGEDDTSVPLDWDKLQALNSRTTIHLIKSAGHMPMWTHPKLFSDILGGILNL